MCPDGTQQLAQRCIGSGAGRPCPGGDASLCELGDVCLSNTCYQKCNAGCPKDHTCVNGTCVRIRCIRVLGFFATKIDFGREIC